MKRFIPTITILLPLFFFAACGPSKTPEANSSAASPAAAAATITASPNPVTTGEGSGTTTITWNTPDGLLQARFMSRRMANPKHFSRRVRRGLPRHLGSKRGKHLSFASMREPSTPRCLRRFRSRVANNSRVASHCGCFNSSYAAHCRSVWPR